MSVCCNLGWRIVSAGQLPCQAALSSFKPGNTIILACHLVAKTIRLYATAEESSRRYIELTTLQLCTTAGSKLKEPYSLETQRSSHSLATECLPVVAVCESVSAVSDQPRRMRELAGCSRSSTHDPSAGKEQLSL